MGSERRVVRQLAGHLLMGAVLGTSLALYLLLSNTLHVFDIVKASEAPAEVFAVFVVGLAAYVAFGATITGFLFMCDEG